VAVAPVTPLGEHIARLIDQDGPLTVHRYMQLCLTHPVHGYYVTRDPLGCGGDFTTAPEISQMFGELVGLWTAAVWQQMGSPTLLRLVEFGPGRGTLMADALRATAKVPGFRDAVSVHLIEASPVLRRAQADRLDAFNVALAWHDTLATVPAGPMIGLANEFLDALPIHQAVRGPDGWHERMVGLAPDGALIFGLSPDPLPSLTERLPAAVATAPVGSLFEWRSDSVVVDLATRLAQHGGAALILDYGHTAPGTGDTLQALRSHRFDDPLTSPGKADLTAHVDFAAVATTARASGAATHGPVEQGPLLLALGLRERAARLSATATTAQRADIDTALARLTDHTPTGMGRLFKVLGLSHPSLTSLPGLG
jgi:SAM-dependent MidA family methyltransferase